MNSLVDAAVTPDGRVGGILNLHVHLRDIATPLLIVKEASAICGGRRSNPTCRPRCGKRHT
jgi:fructose-1,6-bisphosphatase/inositol monophosphatase family enzyme